MRLVTLTVDSFQCIEHAEVDFGPGLNVLYGPNDLGKSSLAAAIRNVLLLPHGSAAHEQLVSWHSGEPPRVALVFNDGTRGFWRIVKSFGSGSAGSSLLEFSKDGISFSLEARAREVDAKVRELLNWGVDPPGGRQAGRGMPDTFLTNVLLAEQIDIPAILARGLTEDPSDAGRQRLNAALQALAQDPTFKRVLDAAQAHVDQAFTPTGQRSRKKSSPFTEIVEEIKTLRERQDELQRKLNDTTSAERTLGDLYARLDVESAELAQAEDMLAAVREAQAQQAARTAVEDELRGAQEALGAIRNELADVEAAAGALDALRARVAGAEATLTEKKQAADAAVLERDEAGRRLQEISSESGVQARQLTMQQLENERLKAESRRSEVLATSSAAEQAARLTADADRARQALAELSARLAAAEQALGTSAAAERAASEALARHELLEKLARLRDAQRRLETAEAALAQARADRETAAGRRGEAAQLESEVARLHLPDAGVVQGLRALAQELEVAEARLGGGLSVALTPLKDVRVHVTADGGEPNEQRGREPRTVEARRSIELRIPDLLHIAITAGEVAARAEVEELRKRWAAEAAPVLDGAGAPTLAALAEGCARGDDLRRQIMELRAGADVLEQQARQCEQQAQGIEVLRRRVAELEPAIAARITEDLEAEIRPLGEDWETEIERRRTAADESARKASEELEAARARSGELRSQHAASEAACRQAGAAADEALTAFPDGLDNTLDEARRELAEIERNVTDVAARVQALSRQADDELGTAQQHFDAAVERVQAATASLEQSQRERDELKEALAHASGALDERQARAARLDPQAAAKAVEAVEQKLAGMPVPTVPAAPEDVARVEGAAAQARAAVATTRGEIQRAQGALEQVGGAVVREQKADIDRALELAMGRERQIEAEYEGWRLLMETMREVENSDGAHLGKALAGPLAERFAALTGGRYGRVAIGQALELETDCIEAGGQLRPYAALSVGTQEQLATLFRLCIAEQLCSAIVLDDHLSQSDPEKLRWFRDLLMKTTERIQVVLFTCRPQDYLLPEELPVGDQAVRDRAGGGVRAVNLLHGIRRYPLAAHNVADRPVAND
jgi:DNA repair exonuclease SbcCD ATPase subunit